MILTGPKIRALIDVGKSWHGVERNSHSDKWVDDSMNYIHVDPYDPELVGPNSIDLRLGNKLLVYEKMTRLVRYSSLGVDGEDPHYQFGPLDMRKENPTKELEIPEEGMVLVPGVLYLGTTIECIGSNECVPIVEGRSSIGRLGLHVHVTAGFCDLGFKGQITLEIHVIHPVRVYAGVPICQAYFLKPEGAIELYKGRYQNQENGPVASRVHLKKDEFE